jgi:hypothetical protein
MSVPISPAVQIAENYIRHCYLHNVQIDPMHIADVTGIPVDVVEFMVAEGASCLRDFDDMSDCF